MRSSTHILLSVLLMSLAMFASLPSILLRPQAQTVNTCKLRRRYWYLLFKSVLIALALTVGSESGFAQDEVQTAQIVFVVNTGEGPPLEFSVSGDGRYIAFKSSSSSIVPNDTNEEADIFVYDQLTKIFKRVSVTADMREANGRSISPSISGDGSLVAFQSNAANLINDSTKTSVNIFVYDLAENSISQMPRDSDRGQSAPAISSDGQYIAYMVRDDIYLYDRETNEQELLVSPHGTTYGMVLSANGEYIAFPSNYIPVPWQIFVYSRLTDETELVSVSPTGEQGNAYSTINADGVAISENGRFVAFQSHASNLILNDTNDVGDVFVRDRETQQIVRMSVGSNGSQLAGWSAAPAISSDGRFVAFLTTGANPPEDTDYPKLQVFLHDRQTGQVTVIERSVPNELENYNFEFLRLAFSGDGTSLYIFSTVGLAVPQSGDIQQKLVLFRYTIQSYPFVIAGNVVDAEGNPIVGVTVSASGTLTATTDQYGQYIISDVFTGTHSVLAEKLGYNFEPVIQSVTVPSSKTNVDFIGSPSPGPSPDTDKQTIVFVHGLNLSPLDALACRSPEPNGYFLGVDDDLKEFYPVTYAYLTTSPCYTASIKDNVLQLIQAIESAKQETNQSKVILVAHSMGGLVARAYIEGNDYNNDVSELFTFGSPHLGVPFDVFRFLKMNGISASELCDIQPGVCDMSLLGMRLFNQEHKPQPSVKYHLITGDAPFLSRSASGMIMDAIIPGSDDGIVQTHSGIGISGIEDRSVTDEVHNSDFGSQSYFERGGDLSVSYNQCLKKVLIDGESTCSDATVVQSANHTSLESMARSPFEQGILLSGQAITRTLQVEGTASLFAAGWQIGTLTLHLVDPSGNLIDPAYALAHPNIVLYQAGALGASYYFTNTAAGEWKMVLQPEITPIWGINYTTFAAFDSAVTLTVGTDQNWYQPNATAIITAALTTETASATISATVYRADGVTDTLSLSPVGGGIYQASYLVPDVSGYTEVRVRSVGATPEGIEFEREAIHLFQITSNQFQLSGSYVDTPSRMSPVSSNYSGITISVGVNAEISGLVGLSADLVTPEGDFVAHANISQEVAQGTNTLSLWFSGDAIYLSQRDGPYTLTNVLLADKREATIVAAVVDNVHMTALYSYQEFRPEDYIYLPRVEQ